MKQVIFLLSVFLFIWPVFGNINQRCGNMSGRTITVERCVSIHVDSSKFLSDTTGRYNKGKNFLNGGCNVYDTYKTWKNLQIVEYVFDVYVSEDKINNKKEQLNKGKSTAHAVVLEPELLLVYEFEVNSKISLIPFSSFEGKIVFQT